MVKIALNNSSVIDLLLSSISIIIISFFLKKVKFFGKNKKKLRKTAVLISINLHIFEFANNYLILCVIFLFFQKFSSIPNPYGYNNKRQYHQFHQQVFLNFHILLQNNPALVVIKILQYRNLQKQFL